MKLSKLDIVVIFIATFCIVGIGIAGFLSDPTNQPVRIAYLSPAFGGVPNVWVSDIDNPDGQRQLTFSEYGVFDFDVSDDGRWLAFAEKNSESIARIRLLDIPNNRVIELVDCIELNAHCTTPVFSPDDTKLAYQRHESIGESYGLSRIWLIDMTTPNYETAPLIADSQVVGHSPVWSQDNNTLAFYSGDTTQPGILIFDFVPREADGVQLRFIPSTHGSMGTISPNGQEIIFPEIVQRDDQLFTHLRIADLLDKEFEAFTDPEGPSDDVVAQWSPDGQTVAISRRYTDDRWTQGYQLYLRDTSSESDDLIPIGYEPNLNTSYFRWNSTGNRLVMQRFPLPTANGSSNRDARPEIWVYDLESDELIKVLEDAFLPQWASP